MSDARMPSEDEHEAYQRQLETAWYVATDRAKRSPVWSAGADEERRRLVEQEFQGAMPQMAQLDEIRRLGT